VNMSSCSLPVVVARSSGVNSKGLCMVNRYGERLVLIFYGRRVEDDVGL
jgi:hypothetical protein